MNIKKTATAIIVYNNKILFFKRDNIPAIIEPDRWQLPGGHIEEGETPLQAIKRELIEEVSYFPKKIYHIGNLKNRFREVNIFWSYVDKNESKKFKLGELEGQEIRFMNVEQALRKKLTKNVRLYLAIFKGVMKKILENKTIPNIQDLKKRDEFA